MGYKFHYTSASHTNASSWVCGKVSALFVHSLFDLTLNCCSKRYMDANTIQILKLLTRGKFLEQLWILFLV